MAMSVSIISIGLDSAFAEHDLPVHAAVLGTAADNFQTTTGAQGLTLTDQVAATAWIPLHLKDIKGAVKTFNAIYHNRFAGDPGKMGASKSASHVDKVASKKKVTPPPAPPSP
jgi:hypothetical protein